MSRNKSEIGGYFELELNQKKEFYPDAIKLNSGRSCLLYILKATKPSKIYLPIYCCNSLVEPMVVEDVAYEFYEINEYFEITNIPNIKFNERLLYINYFGLKTSYARDLAKNIGQSLILDNTQSFFVKPFEDIDTFYSPRKFFGVTDGGYLFTQKRLDEEFSIDTSAEAAIHLLGRLDLSASKFYDYYRSAEHRLAKQPIKHMSRLTQAILTSIEYGKVKVTRERNFLFLHSHLKEYNQIDIKTTELSGPMVYPYLVNEPNLRQKFIGKKIYVASYWKEVLARNCSDNERLMVEQIIPIPIDQRYNLHDMEKILGVVKS